MYTYFVSFVVSSSLTDPSIHYGNMVFTIQEPILDGKTIRGIEEYIAATLKAGVETSITIISLQLLKTNAQTEQKGIHNG